ncbi:hypothetical protein RB6505 [Rhodopirellula baltica SH 1]|uniref:Uncharacterized protein n=2 Tax=Rhodopirellula baltica TaxID=265606 RepID=Q7UQ56_RHOBA|nr:hypothetical protein RB6505 [Rhodopirellula baltica SH 1]
MKLGMGSLAGERGFGEGTFERRHYDSQNSEGFRDPTMGGTFEPLILSRFVV